MRTKDYNRTIWLFSAIITLIILVLGYQLYVSGPRVRRISFERNLTETSLHSGSSATIHFDRPLQQKDYSENISIAPHVDFVATTMTQSITIQFNGSFQHETDYVISVSPGIVDSTGRTMASSYEERVQIGSPEFLYLQRDYEGVQTKDRIVKAKVNSNDEEVLFTATDIIAFVANDEYMVVATRQEEHDEVFTVNLASDEVVKVELTHRGRISNLTLEPLSRTALFIVTPEYNLVGNAYYKNYANRVVALHLELNETQNLTDDSGEFLRGFALHSDRYGRVALYQNELSEFYAVSPYGDYSPILIGSRTYSFGFNDRATEVIFRDNESLTKYEVSSAETEDVILPVDEFIKDLYNTDNGVFYSLNTFTSSGAKGYVYRQETIDSGQAEIIWESPEEVDVLLRKFTPSFDGRLLAIQLDEQGCTYDRVGGNNQCYDTKTILYDYRAERILQAVNGFNVVWLP